MAYALSINTLEPLLLWPKVFCIVLKLRVKVPCYDAPFCSRRLFHGTDPRIVMREFPKHSCLSLSFRLLTQQCLLTSLLVVRLCASVIIIIVNINSLCPIMLGILLVSSLSSLRILYSTIEKQHYLASKPFVLRTPRII